MSIGKRPAIGLVLTLTAVMVFALTTSAHGQNRQYIIKQAGKEIGTAEISIEQGWDTTYMTTQVRYPDSGVEFQTIYLLSGKEFPKSLWSINSLCGLPSVGWWWTWHGMKQPVTASTKARSSVLTPGMC